MPTATPSISLLDNDVGTFDGLGQLLLVLVLMLLVIAAAYYFTRFIGKTMGGQGGSQGVIQVVDRLAVAQNKMIMLVRVGERCFLIGVTQQQLSQLGEMLADELPETDAPPQNAPDRVASYLAGIIKGKNPRQGGGGPNFSDALKRERDAYGNDGDGYAQDDDRDGGRT